MHIDLRKGAQVFAQVWRQFMQTDAVHGADPDRAGDHRSDLAQAILQLDEPADDLLARIVENLPRRSRFDPGPRAFQQAAFVLVFEASDLLADRRLGHEILRGSIRNTAAFNNVAEDL